MLGDVDHVCPLLRLAGERHVAIDGVDVAHRCHADVPPSELDRTTQSRLCLTDAHDRCERLVAYRARHGMVVAGRLAVGDSFASTRLLLAPQPAWRGIAGRARRPRSMLFVGAAAVVGATAIGTAALAMSGALSGDADPSPALSQVAAATATQRPSPTQRATPTALPPTATPAPTATPTIVPTATPAPSPVPTAVPTPVPQQTYTVVAGDTLALIAQRFGTTVEALLAANDIDDPNTINVGQVLVIP